jgi:hypothetical protein
VALLAAYSFDGSGSTVTDYSGNGHDFTLAGSTVTRTAAGHTAGGITGTGTTAANLPQLGQTANRTVMAWLKATSPPAEWPIQWYVASIDSGAWGILWLSGNICIQARNSSTLNRAQTAWPSDGAWHHVAGTYDGTTVRLYLDATLANSVTLAGPLRTDAAAPSVLGAAAGVMDDLRIYDTTLDQATIASLMTTPVTAATITATGTLTAPRATAAAAGTVRITAQGATTARPPTAQGAALVLIHVQGTLAAPTATAQATAAAAITGLGAATAPAAILAGTGQAGVPPTITATGTLLAPAPQAAGHGQVGDRRDITTSVGPLATRWQPGQLATRWQAGELATAWTLGPLEA